MDLGLNAEHINREYLASKSIMSLLVEHLILQLLQSVLEGKVRNLRRKDTKICSRCFFGLYCWFWLDLHNLAQKCANVVWRKLLVTSLGVLMLCLYLKLTCWKSMDPYAIGKGKYCQIRHFKTLLSGFWVTHVC